VPKVNHIIILVVLYMNHLIFSYVRHVIINFVHFMEEIIGCCDVVC
jgi:hypothetical protein